MAREEGAQGRTGPDRQAHWNRADKLNRSGVMLPYRFDREHSNLGLVRDLKGIHVLDAQLEAAADCPPPVEIEQDASARQRSVGEANRLRLDFGVVQAVIQVEDGDRRCHRNSFQTG